MQLSTVVASAALVLAAALAVGHALGQDTSPQSEPKVTMQKKVDEREAQRRAAALSESLRVPHLACLHGGGSPPRAECGMIRGHDILAARQRM